MYQEMVCKQTQTCIHVGFLFQEKNSFEYKSSIRKISVQSRLQTASFGPEGRYLNKSLVTQKQIHCWDSRINHSTVMLIIINNDR